MGVFQNFPPNQLTEYPALLLHDQVPCLTIAELLWRAHLTENAEEEDRTPTQRAYNLPFKSNHHLQDGLCEGKKNKMVTMVTPVTASVTKLPGRRRNISKQQKS